MRCVLSNEGGHEAGAFFGAWIMVEAYGVFSVRACVGDTFILSSGIGSVFELSVCEVMFMEWVDVSGFAEVCAELSGGLRFGSHN